MDSRTSAPLRAPCRAERLFDAQGHFRSQRGLAVQKIGERRAAHLQNLGRLRHAEAESFDDLGSYGRVHSAAHVNEWIATLKSQYNRALSWRSVRCDHATADCTIEVGSDTHPPRPK